MFSFKQRKSESQKGPVAELVDLKARSFVEEQHKQRQLHGAKGSDGKWWLLCWLLWFVLKFFVLMWFVYFWCISFLIWFDGYQMDLFRTFRSLSCGSGAPSAPRFTDTGNFTLRCITCQQGLKGEKAEQSLRFCAVNNGWLMCQKTVESCSVFWWISC